MLDLKGCALSIIFIVLNVSSESEYCIARFYDRRDLFSVFERLYRRKIVFFCSKDRKIECRIVFVERQTLRACLLG